MRRLALALLVLLSASAAATETDYRIDPTASQATFEVRLFWLDHVDGNFTQVMGDVVPGPHPDSWVVDATISVDSVAMPSTRMRRWVLAPSFFDAGHHPTIHFVSNPIAQGDLDRGGMLTGYLTLRGVTAPIQFAVQPVHCEQLSPTPCRITLHGNLQRSTFGMTSDHLAISDSVDLNLSITLQPENR
ncbi:YceI family protein [Dyella caseinilytica]|uniref:YceI family protein n=1 Tax=Dyella caseinilytica TaxID=1849581 RepID=A0ABX7GUG1_9GAMM|nr:YceI family protein [Dyella caseinilytica]QRN53925.1 YceI family protein [Dyella caseinilytica]GFZ90141.1 polyisoprenoid-binding protein [Dyella caseinilytica]